MFGILTDAIEETLNVGESLLSGEGVSKKQIAKLVDAGLTVYAISESTGLAVDVIESLID